MKVLSHEEFVFAVNKIAQRIKIFDIKNIYGIPRGGSVVAVYLSHITGLPVTKLISKKTLITDDIADSGKTLLPYKWFKTATIYYHKQSVVEPTVWIYEKKDEWIKFPWETKESTGGE